MVMFRDFGKRAQFFLLAAVIISAIVISLGITANRAVVSKETGEFRDFSYEVRREVGAVLDYEVYTDVAGGELDDFVGLLVNDTTDSNPDVDIVVVYGDENGVKVKNKGKDSIGVRIGEDAEEITLEGAKEEYKSTVCEGEGATKVCYDVDSTVGEIDDSDSTMDIREGELINIDSINLNVGGQDVEFKPSDYKQALFVIRRKVKDENFVEAG